jgi:hypothetical protein
VRGRFLNDGIQPFLRLFGCEVSLARFGGDPLRERRVDGRIVRQLQDSFDGRQVLGLDLFGCLAAAAVAAACAAAL